MKNFFKSIGLSVVLALAFIPTSKSADLYTSAAVTANTVKSVLSPGGYLLKAVTWINTSTNIATIKFYDQASTVTNITNGVTFSTTYATNWTSIFTNAAGIVMTNTFSGFYTGGYTNVAATVVERPKLLTMLVPASQSVNLTDINKSVSMGLAVLSDNVGTYLITYDTQ